MSDRTEQPSSVLPPDYSEQLFQQINQYCKSIAEKSHRRSRALRRACVPAKNAWPSPWVASSSLLAEVAYRSARATGPVLELGSGLSSAVIAACTRLSAVPVHILEHDAQWFEVTRRLTSQYEHVVVHLCPLREYSDFDWYDVPDALADRFDFVLCDGPPGSTRGGRKGLVAISDRVAGATIVLDDTDRKKELEVLTSWGDAWGTKWRTTKPAMISTYRSKLNEAYHRRSYSTMRVPDNTP